MTAIRPSVAVIGGGYAGINVAKGLDPHADVVLVEAKDAFQHTVAALRALVAPEWLERVFFPYNALLAHGTVRHDRAVEVGAGHVLLASGERLEPDYIVVATGSAYPFPAKSDHLRSTDAMMAYRSARSAIDRANRVLLVGAGPVGIELAGEIATAWPDKPITLVDVADDVLSGPFDDQLRAELRRQLTGLGVELHLGSPLTKLPATEPGVLAPVEVSTDAGTTVTADVWFRCFGTAPCSGYLIGDLSLARTADGYITVDSDLRVTGQSRVFALGDVSAIDANRAGVAGRQAPVVVANILADIAGDAPTARYERLPPAIILPLGPTGGTGQAPSHDGLIPAETVAELKGRDMMIARYRDIFNRPV